MANEKNMIASLKIYINNHFLLLYIYNKNLIK